VKISHKEKMRIKNFVGIVNKFLNFIKSGWFWILFPTLIALIIITSLILFCNPYQEGALHGKFILLYSLFKT